VSGVQHDSHVVIKLGPLAPHHALVAALVSCLQAQTKRASIDRSPVKHNGKAESSSSRSPIPK
jgi:hypothetical protein